MSRFVIYARQKEGARPNMVVTGYEDAETEVGAIEKLLMKRQGDAVGTIWHGWAFQLEEEPDGVFRVAAPSTTEGYL